MRSTQAMQMICIYIYITYKRTFVYHRYVHLPNTVYCDGSPRTTSEAELLSTRTASRTPAPSARLNKSHKCLMFRSNDTLQYYCFQTAAFFNRVAGLEQEFWTCQVITDGSLWLRKPKKAPGRRFDPRQPEMFDLKFFFFFFFAKLRHGAPSGQREPSLPVECCHLVGERCRGLYLHCFCGRNSKKKPHRCKMK